MKPYLDSLGFNSYDSINHEEETKPSRKNNDEKIGIISIIGIIMYVSFLIWRWID